MAILERYDPAGYVIFAIMPSVALLGTMIASFIVARNVGMILGLITLPVFAGMGITLWLGMQYIDESGTRAYQLAKGETVVLRRLPFMAPVDIA